MADLSFSGRRTYYLRLLRALCAVPDRLTEVESEAFPRILRWLENGDELSPAQRDWVRERYLALELDADEGSANLWSSGKVPQGIVMPKSDKERQAEKTLAVRPLKPPRREPEPDE